MDSRGVIAEALSLDTSEQWRCCHIDTAQNIHIQCSNANANSILTTQSKSQDREKESLSLLLEPAA